MLSASQAFNLILKRNALLFFNFPLLFFFFFLLLGLFHLLFLTSLWFELIVSSCIELHVTTLCTFSETFTVLVFYASGTNLRRSCFPKRCRDALSGCVELRCSCLKILELVPVMYLSFCTLSISTLIEYEIGVGRWGKIISSYFVVILTLAFRLFQFSVLQPYSRRFVHLSFVFRTFTMHHSSSCLFSSLFHKTNIRSFSLSCNNRIKNKKI